jgi:hypothetical protein
MRRTMLRKMKRRKRREVLQVSNLVSVNLALSSLNWDLRRRRRVWVSRAVGCDGALPDLLVITTPV